MCQQFANALPCKIGEMRCTFPHNNIEMKVWYMERDGEFSVTKFIEDLCNNEIGMLKALFFSPQSSFAKVDIFILHLYMYRHTILHHVSFPLLLYLNATVVYDLKCNMLVVV